MILTLKANHFHKWLFLTFKVDTSANTPPIPLKLNPLLGRMKDQGFLTQAADQVTVNEYEVLS